MSADTLTAVLGPRATTNRLYVALDDEADPRQVADALEAEHLHHGVQARTFRDIVAQRQQDNLRFLRILQGYLMLGLLIGIAGSPSSWSAPSVNDASRSACFAPSGSNPAPSDAPSCSKPP